MPDAKPLSAGQKALWTLQQMAPAGSAYNVVFGVRLHGPLDLGDLRAAVAALIERHEPLRSAYPLIDGEPGRVAGVFDPDQFEVRDATGLDDAAARALLHELCRTPFALETGPLFRVIVLRQGPERVMLALVAHHIATDAVSQGLLVEELLSGDDAASGRPFDDVVARESRILGSARRTELETYWRQACAGAPLVLDLPRDRPRPRTSSFSGRTIELVLDEAAVSRLRTASAEAGVTPFLWLLSVFQILLYRYTGQEDLLVACPTMTRFAGGMRDTIGYLVNTMPIRARIGHDDTGRDVLSETRRTFVDGLRHLDLPYAELPRLLNAPHDPGRQPVCQVAFTMVATDHRRPLLDLVAAGEPGAHRTEIGDLTVHPLDIDQQEGQFDLAVEALLSSTVLRLLFRYDTSLYEAAFMEQFARHFRGLLNTVLSDPDRPLGRIPLPDEAERRHLLALGATEGNR